MRGFPLLNLLIALAVSGAVFFPLVWRQTHVTAPAVVAPAPEPDAGPSRVSSHISLRFVHPPASVELRSGETLLHQWSKPSGLLLEETAALPVSDNRLAFELRIAWPEGTPEANNVVVEIEPEGAQSWKDVYFSDGGNVDEIIEFDLRP